jgi:type IV pilus assembly protein PilV
MNNPPHPRLSTASHGFSLIEVLVTIVVLCFGMLGSIALQAAALQSNAQTRHQVVAAGLGSELAEYMRGNQQVALQRSVTSNPYLLSHQAGLPTAPAVDCRRGDCVGTTANDREDIAVWQAHDWLSRAIGALPSPRVEVCFDSAPFSADTGMPHWDCDGVGATATIKLAWTSRDTSGELRLMAERPLLVMPVTPGAR